MVKTAWDSEPLVLDHRVCIVGLIRYGYSGMTRCPGRGQATVAEGPNPPGRDFVNALLLTPVAEQLPRAIVIAADTGRPAHAEQ